MHITNTHTQRTSNTWQCVARLLSVRAILGTRQQVAAPPSDQNKAPLLPAPGGSLLRSTV